MLNFFLNSKAKGNQRFDAFYIEGPGDVVEAFKCWSDGKHLETETSKTYSGQMFDFFKKYKIRALIQSYHFNTKFESDEQFLVRNKPKQMLSDGINYHLTQVFYGFLIVVMAIRHRPYVVHVTSGVTHFWILAPLRFLGIKIVAHMHNCLWPIGFYPVRKSSRFFLWLDGYFFRKLASAVVCVSPEIERQVKRISGVGHCEIYQFRGQFYREDFDNSLNSVPIAVDAFRIVFAGRIERNKGVFDILKMATILRNERIIFDICGGGGAFQELQDEAAKVGALDLNVFIHGALGKSDLLRAYRGAHAVIVPTRSDFAEAFAKVAAEAILLGRPAICSSVVPANEMLQGATISVSADDVDEYVRVIRRLASDPELYEELRRGCATLRETFLDGTKGLSCVLETVYHNLEITKAGDGSALG